MRTTNLLLICAVLVAGCTIAPEPPKPRTTPILSGNAPITIVPTHDSIGTFTGYYTSQGYVDLLNSLYDQWGYLLTPPRKAGFGIEKDGAGYRVTAEAERNRLILEAYRDIGKPKQGIISKISDHL